MTGKRRCRDRRSKSKPVVLTERDKALLVLVGLCRYVSTEQVARELFPSKDRAQHRLRQLFDAGVLDITLADSRHSNLYGLTAEGLATVKQFFPHAAARVQASSTIRLAGIVHHLAVVDTRLFLAGLCKGEDLRLLAWDSGSSQAARDLGFGVYRLRPDAVAQVESPVETRVLAVEVDCGTEGLDVLQSKAGRYLAALAGGVLDEFWVVAMGGQGRLKEVRQLVVQAGIGAQTRVMPHADILVRPARELPAVVGPGSIGLASP